MTEKDKDIAAGGCPMHAGEPGRAYGSTELTYNDYLKVPELLSLQVPQSEPPHHDEMLFIVIHQTYELWFKLVLHELENAARYMRESKVLRARHFVNRSVEIFRVLIQQIHILETMTPAEFLQFRFRLAPASGFQSIQFRELEYMLGLRDESYLRFFANRPDLTERLRRRLDEPDLPTDYWALLANLGYDLPPGLTEVQIQTHPELHAAVMRALLAIYQDPESNLPLYLLSESLVELDEGIGLWREHHVRVVERVIGHRRGTGGSTGVGYLRGTTSKKCFPLLWEVRSHLADASATFGP